MSSEGLTRHPETRGSGRGANHRHRWGILLTVTYWEKLETLEKAAAEAACVRGRNYRDWGTEIAELKRAREHADALALLYESMDAAEREERVDGSGYLPSDLYADAAIIHRKEKDYASELKVLERYLVQVRDSDSIGLRAHIEARYRKAWKLQFGTDDAILPQPVDKPIREADTVRSLTDELVAKHRWKAEKQRLKDERQADKFNSQPPLEDDAAEAHRRSQAGLPWGLLDKVRWRKAAISLAGQYPDTQAVIESLLARADRWGVVDPDHGLVESAFERAGGLSDAIIDLRTGEEFWPRFIITTTELWVAAVTDLPVRAVERTIGRLQPDGGEIISFWQIPGDMMDGKAELHLRD